jgi:hypothetical protein
MGVAGRIGLAKKGSQLIDADNTFRTNFARSSHIPGDEGVSGCDPYSGLLSGFGACTPRHKVVPAGQIGELRSYFNVCQRAADVDCDQRRNISDCVAVAGNELITAQFAIHPFETPTNCSSLLLPVFRELFEAASKDWTRPAFSKFESYQAALSSL